MIHMKREEFGMMCITMPMNLMKTIKMIVMVLMNLNMMIGYVTLNHKCSVLLELRKGINNMDKLEKVSKDLLYDESKGCDKEFTKLRSVLELQKLKANHGWFDTSFTKLLSLLANLLLKPNNLPVSTYRAKKLICPLPLGVIKIHACLNYCIMYRKEYEFSGKWLICGVGRYKSSYNHVYVDNMKKNKNSTIGPESEDDTFDRVDKKRRRITTVVV
jgi:hypothetical protein